MAINGDIHTGRDRLFKIMYGRLASLEEPAPVVGYRPAPRGMYHYTGCAAFAATWPITTVCPGQAHLLAGVPDLRWHWQAQRRHVGPFIRRLPPRPPGRAWPPRPAGSPRWSPPRGR